MYKGKSILALITARGGSKGILRKNIKPLGSIPLINWTIQSARLSKYIDRLIISTEDEEIANRAQESGCEVPFMRPTELAADTSTSMDVIFHALNNVQNNYDYLLLLQPTSPFREVSHIDSIIEQGIDSFAPITVSVNEVKKHPAFMYELKAKKLVPLLRSEKHSRRQDMSKVYEHNGALYLAEIKHLFKVKTFNDDGVEAFIMDRISSVDLDESLDWIFAESILEKKLIL